ncbi:MAG: ABC transporter permease [Saprospiraceae bacterium]
MTLFFLIVSWRKFNLRLLKNRTYENLKVFIGKRNSGKIFRNPAIIRLIFAMPAIQLIILPMVAADYEVKNVEIAVVDQDHSPYSQQLISKTQGSDYFELTEFSDSYQQSLETVERDKADLVLQIPSGFERNLIKEK